MLPRTGLPLLASLQITYAFQAEDGQEHLGRFQTSASDEGFWIPGSDVELFYLAADPEMNMPSLVLRWYFRLGGSAIADEIPSADFSEEDVEVDWVE